MHNRFKYFIVISIYEKTIMYIFLGKFVYLYQLFFVLYFILQTFKLLCTSSLPNLFRITKKLSAYMGFFCFVIHFSNFHFK